jgi:hypothetical protein
MNSFLSIIYITTLIYYSIKNYNFRRYSERRIKDEFRKNKTLQNGPRDEAYFHGLKELDALKR